MRKFLTLKLVIFETSGAKQMRSRQNVGCLFVWGWVYQYLESDIVGSATFLFFPLSGNHINTHLCALIL